MRVDKFLFFVRLFKTRTDATDAVKTGRVTMNGGILKPSYEVAVGDVFSLRRNPVLYTFRVKGFPKSRLGAKLVGEYLEDLTPQEELDKLVMQRQGIGVIRYDGGGRPTKRDRRALEALRDAWDVGDADEF